MELDPGEAAAWLRAFIFTQAVEVPLYVVALSRLSPALPLSRRIGLAFLCSLLTHPVVWFVFPRLFDSAHLYEVMVAAAETFAITSEALLLARLAALPARRAALLSFAANFTSMSLGFLTRSFFDWV
jgi:hypothetical protein